MQVGHGLLGLPEFVAVAHGSTNMDPLPDLCVVWKMLPRALRSVLSDHGPIAAGTRHPERGGNHRLSGFFLALGPDVDAAARSVQGDLLDLAPTAMHLLRGGVPAGLDGQILPILR